MGIFKRTVTRSVEASESSPDNYTTEKVSKHPSPENPSKRHVLPTWQHEGRLRTKYIEPDGESGRSGFHPYHFLRVIWRSATPFNTYLNLLWPFVPAAIVLHFVWGNSPLEEGHHTAVFAVNFLGIIAPASMLGFAGQELARKLPRVAGILIETTLGGVVEIVLFSALIVKSTAHEQEQGYLVPVIQAAILGSILANLLFCLGICFMVGGLKWKEQKFHSVVSEAGSGLLLVAGFALLIPTAYHSALQTTAQSAGTAFTPEILLSNTLRISRGTAVILMFAFLVYILWSVFSHDSIFDEVLRQDEENDADRERDLARSKLTLTEAIIAILISLTFISLLSVFLVEEIEPLVDHNHVPDNFLGLILVPLVEKFAEHITAIDEAYDNQINFALYHCLGPSIQTALFNAPLVVFIGWGLNKDMSLNFEIFMIVVLVLSILVVGNFLRDGASNYLEGTLLLLVYIIIALTAYYYPNASDATTNGDAIAGGEGSGEAAGEVIELAARSLKALVA